MQSFAIDKANQNEHICQDNFSLCFQKNPSVSLIKACNSLLVQGANELENTAWIQRCLVCVLLGSIARKRRVNCPH